MSHWTTSGRSRLKAKQNRSFSQRAQQRANVVAPYAVPLDRQHVHSNGEPNHPSTRTRRSGAYRMRGYSYGNPIARRGVVVPIEAPVDSAAHHLISNHGRPQSTHSGGRRIRDPSIRYRRSSYTLPDAQQVYSHYQTSPVPRQSPRPTWVVHNERTPPPIQHLQPPPFPGKRALYYGSPYIAQYGDDLSESIGPEWPHPGMVPGHGDSASFGHYSKLPPPQLHHDERFPRLARPGISRFQKATQDGVYFDSDPALWEDDISWRGCSVQYPNSYNGGAMQMHGDSSPVHETNHQALVRRNIPLSNTDNSLLHGRYQQNQNDVCFSPGISFMTGQHCLTPSNVFVPPTSLHNHPSDSTESVRFQNAMLRAVEPSEKSRDRAIVGGLNAPHSVVFGVDTSSCTHGGLSRFQAPQSDSYHANEYPVGVRDRGLDSPPKNQFHFASRTNTSKSEQPTESFLRFFDNGLQVDENGRPLQLYTEMAGDTTKHRASPPNISTTKQAPGEFNESELWEGVF